MMMMMTNNQKEKDFALTSNGGCLRAHSFLTGLWPRSAGCRLNLIASAFSRVGLGGWLRTQMIYCQPSMWPHTFKRLIQLQTSDEKCAHMTLLECAHLAAKPSLSVSEHGQLSLSFLRGRLMSYCSTSCYSGLRSQTAEGVVRGVAYRPRQRV